MASFKRKLTIYQGATFDDIVVWKMGDSPETAIPVDLTGCTARAHIRPDLDSSTVLMRLTTENGRIALGGATGSIRIRIEADDTAAIDWGGGIYDLEIRFPDGTVMRKMKGMVVVSREVTRGD